MAVKLHKMVTGEDVIANAEADNDESKVVFRNPARLVIAPQGIGMMPWAPLANEAQSEKITIRRDHIVFALDLDTEILNAYNQQFGSGIVIPDQSMVGSMGMRIVTDE